MIAAAQVGAHNGKRSSYGHSMVVDPWGKVSGSSSLAWDVDFEVLVTDLL